MICISLPIFLELLKFMLNQKWAAQIHIFLSAEKHIYVFKTQFSVCNLSGISKKQTLKSSVTGRQVVVKAIPSLLEVFTTFTDSDEPDSCTEAFLVDTRYMSQHLSF